MSSQPVEDTSWEEAVKPLYVDKRKLQPILEELHKQMHESFGYVPNLGATTEEIRARMIAEGVRPEENLFSSAIVAARYPDEDTTAEGWE